MFIVKQVLKLLRRVISNTLSNYKVYQNFGLILSDGMIISNTYNITLGSNFAMSTDCLLLAQGNPGDATIIIGNNVALNVNVMINADCGGKIIIGNDVIIGPNTVMRAANHGIEDINLPIYKQGHKPGEINIKDEFWLGANVTVLPNVTIGASSVVGAGSVVKSDIPPFSIAVGVPAKVIKQRKNE